jgi:hypothetical protein
MLIFSISIKKKVKKYLFNSLVGVVCELKENTFVGNRVRPAARPWMT